MNIKFDVSYDSIFGEVLVCIYVYIYVNGTTEWNLYIIKTNTMLYCGLTV
jgi:hypothetical protein